MRVEQYLLEYIRQHHLSEEQVERDTGTNLQLLIDQGRELVADEFLHICNYLGITPDEVSDQIL